MYSNNTIQTANKLYLPQSYNRPRIVDVPDETGKRAGASQDWTEFYENYPKIKSVLPAKLRTDKDVEVLNYCRSRGIEYKDPAFKHNLEPLVDPKGVLIHKDWETLKW